MAQEIHAEIAGLLIECPSCKAHVPVKISPYGAATRPVTKSESECPLCKGKIIAGWTTTGVPYGRAER